MINQNPDAWYLPWGLFSLNCHLSRHDCTEEIAENIMQTSHISLTRTINDEANLLAATVSICTAKSLNNCEILLKGTKTCWIALD